MFHPPNSRRDAQRFLKNSVESKPRQKLQAQAVTEELREDPDRGESSAANVIRTIRADTPTSINREQRAKEQAKETRSLVAERVSAQHPSELHPLSCVKVVCKTICSLSSIKRPCSHLESH